MQEKEAPTTGTVQDRQFAPAQKPNTRGTAGPGDAKENLFNPPADIFEASEGHTPWEPEVREEAMQMYKKCPDLLKKSLRCWLKAAIEGAPHDDPTRISTKRLGHVVYGMRGLRLRELVSLTQAEDFADAIYKLTGHRLGHLSQGTPRNKSEQEGMKAHWPLGTLPKSSPRAREAYNQRAPEKGKGGKNPNGKISTRFY